MSDFAPELQRARDARYSSVAIALHWAIFAAIVLQVVLSTRMGGKTPEAFAVMQLHKSVGVTILALSLVRLAWRLTHPPPPMPATLARWERVLARVTHVGLYVIMIGMPLTGWLIVSTSRIEVPTLLYGTIPWPDLPFDGLAAAARGAWREVGEFSHDALSKGLYVLAGLHVAGALKHQLFSRDEPVLARMAPGARAGRWLEPRLLAILAAFVGVVAFGRLVQPPHPGMAPPPPAATAPAAAVKAVRPTEAAPAPATNVPSGPVQWRVAEGSKLGFTTSWSGQPIQGRFERWRASIIFSPDALDRSSVTVVVDLASARTGDRQRDEVLPSGDWFDVAAHPQAVFRTTSIRKTGEDRYAAEGTLEMRGVTRPLSLPFRLEIAGDRAEVTGTVSLDRTAYGVGQGEFAATEDVPAKVGVRVQLKAIRDGR